MDVSTIIGVSVGVLIMVTSIVLGGAPFSIFVDSSAILCVVGGSLCAVMICYPLRAIMLLPFAIVRTVFVQTPNTQQITEQIVRLAGIARRDGLLALENRLEELPSPLLRLGLQLAIDGTKPEIIEDVLRSEIQAIAHRHLLCKGVLDQLGRFAPAFGMIGTMLGLVMMLNKMTDPSSIGSGMAVALLTTLYGAVLANLFCLPLSEKLSYYHREEIQSLELISKGVMAVQSGDNPRVIEQKLRTVHVPQPPALRKAA
jgi:chemotaxis protein MotA